MLGSNMLQSFEIVQLEGDWVSFQLIGSLPENLCGFERTLSVDDLGL